MRAVRSGPEPLQVAALRQNTSTSPNTDVHRCRTHTLHLHEGMIKSMLLFFLKYRWDPARRTCVEQVSTSWQHLPAGSAVPGQESLLALQLYTAKGMKTLLLGQFWTELESWKIAFAGCLQWLKPKPPRMKPGELQRNSSVPPRLLAWASSHPDIA